MKELYISRISKGFTYIIGLSFLQFLVGLVFYSVVAKVLTQADIGIISTLTFLYTIFTALAPIALPVAGTKYLSEFLGKNDLGKAADVASTIIRLVAKVSLIFFALFSLSSFFIVSSFHSIPNATLFLMLNFIASFIATIRITILALLQGLQLFDKYAISNTMTGILSRLASLILVISGYGLSGYALGLMLGEILGLGLTFHFYKRSPLPKPTGKYDSKLLLKFSIPIYIMTIVTVVSDWVDRVLFLAVSSDLQVLGVYELAIRGVGVLTIIWAIIDVTVLPVFSENYGQAGKEALTPLLKKAMRYLAFVFFPAAFGLASISRTIMTLLFGPQYIAGSLALTLLSISAMFTAFSTIIGSTLKSIGETGVFIKVSLLSILVDGILVITLAPTYGLLGALAGKIASAVIGFIYIANELRSKIKVEIDKEGLWKCFASAMLLSVVLVIFERLYTNILGSPDALILEICLGIGSYILGLFLSKAMIKDDFRLLRQMIPKPLSPLVSLFERLLVR